MNARLDKQRRHERALARSAEVARQRTLAALASTGDVRRLLDLLDELATVSPDTWPRRIADARWLLAQTQDFRTTAVRLVDDAYCERLLAQGLEPMDEPLPWEDPSACQVIRALLSQARAAAPLPDKPRTTRPPMLTIHLSSPADVPALVSTLDALLRQLQAPAPCAPAIVSAPAAETATPVPPVEEPTKRKRRTKAEMEADAAAAQTAATETEPDAAAEEPTAPPDAAPDESAPTPETVTEALSDAPWAHCFQTEYTAEQVQKAFREWALKAGGSATRAVLAHLGAQKSSEIGADKYQTLMALTHGMPI